MGLPERSQCSSQKSCSLKYVHGETLTEAAMSSACHHKSRKVALVNAASAYTVGGGFVEGGRHALEESLCAQTTLYFSLRRASEIAATQNDGHGLQDANGLTIHVPENGCVVSPDTILSRHGTDSGYAPLRGSVRLAA